MEKIKVKSYEPNQTPSGKKLTLDEVQFMLNCSYDKALFIYDKLQQKVVVNEFELAQFDYDLATYFSSLLDREEVVMIEVLKTKQNVSCESETIYLWLEDNTLVLRSLISLSEELTNQNLPYILSLNLEGIQTSPTFLIVTLFDRKAYSKKDPVHNLVTHYRNIEHPEETIKLLESLKSYVPLLKVLYDLSQRKSGLIFNYTEWLSGVVTFSYYDFTGRLVHDSKLTLSHLHVSTYSDTANYFELQTEGKQGNALTVQLSVDEQTELTFSSKKDFVTLKELPESLDSMFSDLAQYMDTSLTIS